jgi:hypothetical protein
LKPKDGKNCLIQKQDPLKQGLKLVPELKAGEAKIIQKQDPLKQGLKLHGR